MLNARNQLAALALAVALGACASASKQAAVLSAPATGGATVIVQNKYSEDVAVYVVIGNGSRWRLGTAMRFMTDKFLIPDHMLIDPRVQVVADPIGPGSTLAFARMLIRPGSTIDVVLEHEFARSTIWLR